MLDLQMSLKLFSTQSMYILKTLSFEPSSFGFLLYVHNYMYHNNICDSIYAN